MKIKIIIEDVDVSVAQLLGLLNEQESVTVEVEQTQAVVPAPVEVLAPVQEKKEELPSHITSDPTVKGGKRYTCPHCKTSYTYEKSYKKCVDRCIAKKERKTKEAKEQSKEKPKEKPKAKPKFVRKRPKVVKPKKKSKPAYVSLTDSELNEMVAGHILGNPNTIVTSMQIASHYVASAKKRYEMTTVATQELNSIESRIVVVLQKIADVFGPSQSMSMPIAPNGLQVALFAKKKPTVAQLVEKLK